MAKQNGESTDRDILNRILSILEKQGKPCENSLKNRVYDSILKCSVIKDFLDIPDAETNTGTLNPMWIFFSVGSIMRLLPLHYLPYK